MDSPPQDYDNILDNCITALQQGTMDIAACLDAYPAHAAELETDLKLMLLTTRLKQPRLQAEAVSTFERQIYRAMPVKPKEDKVIRLNPFAAMSRTAAAVIIALLLVVGGGSMTVAASADAMPGDPLYGVKRFWESIIVLLAEVTGQMDDVSVQLAETRLTEVYALTANGELEDAHLDDLAEALQTALNHEADLTRLQGVLQQTAQIIALPEVAAHETQVTRLQGTLNNAPNAPNNNSETPLIQATPTTASTVQATTSSTPTATHTATATLSPTPTLTATQTLPPTWTPRFAPTATRTPEGTPILPTNTTAPSATWTPLPTLTFGPTLPTIAPTQVIASPNPVNPVQATSTPFAPRTAQPSPTWYPWIQATFDACNMTRTAVPGEYDTDPYCGSGG